MKTAISIPDAVFERVEAHARRLGISRSEFFSRAAARLADELDAGDVTAAIDAVLADGARSDTDDFVRRAASRTLGSEPT